MPAIFPRLKDHFITTPLRSRLGLAFYLANAPEETTPMVEPGDVLGSSVVLSSLDRIAHVVGWGPIQWGRTQDTDETQLNWAVAGLTGRTSDRDPRSMP